ncbi:MAG: helix-turn-helix transcriptional regulator, partial [Clostridia bacterium]|nr:helix-turn-helix transcriptional regulator [Clostridia bacterium]
QLERSEKQTASVVVVNRTTEYIHRHFAEPLSQEDIATTVRFHKTYINRCMLEELGTTMHQYLLRYRLEKAMQMLLYTQDSIAEIAVKTGFTSSKNFATAFRKYYSLPPSAVRKKQEDIHG